MWSALAVFRECQLLGVKRWMTRELERRSVMYSKGVEMKEGVYCERREVMDGLRRVVCPE